MSSKIRLGVNIDHVATVRQARGEAYPSVADAARTALDFGADQITIHLREDRRHIQTYDVFDVRNITTEKKALFNLEMACEQEVTNIAVESRPDWVCLVPEKREEKTTEGGLDILNPKNFEKIKKTCETLKSYLPELKISLFLESQEEVLEKTFNLPIDAVEIHTGEFAKMFLAKKDTDEFLQNFRISKKLLNAQDIHCHAGHGLTLPMMKPLLEEDLFEEYNVGHWIISQAIFDGLGPVVKSFRSLMDNLYTIKDQNAYRRSK
ncbi:MAG: pyridoxine 5'-phosphate synthase [Halobacteriovoraceae bacterium]|nr:pyridoxine 5'-phosphate synthase [Halobacteriovoraceae bacterium]MCB9093669.1 pyridoxine 5'-phosphate synthase [Halobacteriovoraceae bacterium]